MHSPRPSRSLRYLITLLATLPLLVPLSDGARAAEAYPARTVRIVVPFAPGGSTDPIARLVAQQLTETLKQPFIVDNRPGGATMIGTEFVARSAPDGHTMLLASSSHVVNPSLFRKVNYDPVRDFQGVSLALSFPLLLTVNPTVEARTVLELIALAKGSPGRIPYASGGVGAANHLAGEMFKSLAGVNLIHVPYKGGGPALTDHLGGQVAVMFGSIQQSLPHVRSGKLRGLAVSGARRSSLAPDLPTIAEAGVPGYDVTSWNGFLVPAGTPASVVTLLNTEITRILRLPQTRDTLAAQGADPYPTTPKETQDFLAGEVLRWAKLIQAAGIRAD